MSVKFHRYSFGPINHSGRQLEWAIVLIDSTGMFAVASDYGDYCIKWAYWGDCDIRKFLCRIHSGYLLERISKRSRFDVKATVKAIKHDLIETRRGFWHAGKRVNGLSKDFVRDEWDSLEDIDSNHEFEKWCSRTSLSEAYEYAVYEYPHSAVNFAELILPRLQKAMRAQLQQEKNIREYEEALTERINHWLSHV